MPLTTKEVNELVEKCTKDENILIRPTRESATLYGVKYDEMLHIRRKVRYSIGREKKPSYLRKIDVRKKKHRIEKSLRETNIKYPGIIRDVYEGANLSVLAEKFALSRQRVHQFKKNIEKLMEIESSQYVRDLIYHNPDFRAKRKSKKKAK